MVIWLSGLHHPEAYITALVQTTCRRNGWSLDRSTLYTTVTEYVDESSITERPPSGCYATGLFLEGAEWDIKSSELKRLPTGSRRMVNPLPVLRIIPMETSRIKLQHTLKTPVYTTQDRRNAMGTGLVFEADLATKEHPSIWILQNIALVCFVLSLFHTDKDHSCVAIDSQYGLDNRCSSSIHLYLHYRSKYVLR